MIKAGIIGGAGYTAGELLRILINHPEVEISFVNSKSNAGAKLYSVHEGLIGETEMEFADYMDLESIDVLFLCSAHGDSKVFLEANPLPGKLKVVDLAQDFRDESCGFVYGLPEYQRDRIRNARLVANPGCFATCIQLGLLPLASAGLLKNEVAVTGITGSTGAGVKPSPTSHFSWRNNNISVYKAFTHQHLLEINRTLSALQGSAPGTINFVPVRGDFARGIFAVMFTDCALSEEEARRKAAEAKKAAAADGTALSKKPGKIETYKTDSEDRRLSNIFERNKGILPAPITGPYAVVGHYGKYEVKGLRNVRLDNKGIDIKGKPGANARAIFDGEVSAVFQYNGLTNVLVRHGSYISVYCNLSSVRVKKGSPVKTKDILGEIHTDKDGNTVLHFQLRKETAKLNPELWIAR